jgi:hypothetical protein
VANAAQSRLRGEVAVWIDDRRRLAAVDRAQDQKNKKQKAESGKQHASPWSLPSVLGQASFDK